MGTHLKMEGTHKVKTNERLEGKNRQWTIVKNKKVGMQRVHERGEASIGVGAIPQQSPRETVMDEGGGGSKTGTSAEHSPNSPKERMRNRKDNSQGEVLHWRKLRQQMKKAEKAKEKRLKSAKKRDRPSSGKTPVKSKKGPDGELIKKNTEEYHSSVKHLFKDTEREIKPYDETIETAMELSSDNESDELETDTTNLNPTDNAVGQANIKIINHEEVERWLYDDGMGPLKDLFQKGLKTTQIEFASNLQEILKSVTEVNNGTDESLCKIQTLEEKLMNQDREFEKFKNLLPKEWKIYEKAMLSGKTILSEIFDIIAHDEFQIFEYLLETDELDKMLKLHTRRNIRLFYIPPTAPGTMADFYTPYETSMEGDFPILINSNKSQQQLYIPSRVKDELKWLAKGLQSKRYQGSSKLERRCEKAYFTIPGWGYIGSKYEYKEMSDLIGRRTFYQDSQEGNTLRILKCTGVFISDQMEKAIFTDKTFKCYLTHDDLTELGYSRINPE